MASFKIAFGDEIRRLPGNFFQLSEWTGFCQQLRQLFQQPLPGIGGEAGPFRLTYVDDEGETITIRSAEELRVAMELAVGPVRLKIDKKVEAAARGESEDPKRAVARKPERSVRGIVESLEPATANGLMHNMVIQLQGEESFPDKFILKVLPCGVICLVPEATPCWTVRVTPLRLTVDYRGRGGPFAQFKTTQHGDQYSLLNAKTNCYLNVRGGQLVAEPTPAHLSLLPSQQDASPVAAGRKVHPDKELLKSEKAARKAMLNEFKAAVRADKQAKKQLEQHLKQLAKQEKRAKNSSPIHDAPADPQVSDSVAEGETEVSDVEFVRI